MLRLQISHAVSIDGYVDVPANNESALMKAAAQQPVSVAIEAGGVEFQFYLNVGILLYNHNTMTPHVN